MAKKSNQTSKKIKHTSERLSKKTGIPAGVIYFFILLLLILVVLASEYLGFTTITRTYIPDVYEMVFPATPTALVSQTDVTVPTETGFINGEGDWWELYFTEPTVINDPETQVSPLQEVLVGLIDDSVSKIDIAAFEFNLVPIMDAVVAAEERGVEVRWVTDDEYGIEEDELEGHDYFKNLEDAGVEVIDDDRSGLMHNKYIIFDDAIVWTGSTNLTINGMYKNNNNSIVIYSKTLADIYETDFEEMWAGDFGARSESTVDEQTVIIADSEITALFSPEDDAADYLAAFVSQAADSIYFMAFSFTHEAIGNAMMDVYDSGVTVSGIFETRGSETEYSELTAFHCLGMPVRQDGNPATFHHKVIIIDQRWVVTGSFNFSNNADESNSENLIIIDNPEIATLFLLEFERRWDEAEAPDPGDLSCP